MKRSRSEIFLFRAFVSLPPSHQNRHETDAHGRAYPQSRLEHAKKKYDHAASP